MAAMEEGKIDVMVKLKREQQKKDEPPKLTWKLLREHLTKPGCVLVTVPSLEEATMFNNKACIDINSWVKPCPVSYSVPQIPSYDEDIDELQNIFFYLVK